MNGILMSANEAQGDILQAVKDYLTNTNSDNDNQLKQAVIVALTENTSLTDSQATEVVNAWQGRYQKAMEKAKDQTEQIKLGAIEAGKKLSGRLSKAAWISFVVLLLGVVAAGWGGATGTMIRCKKA